MAEEGDDRVHHLGDVEVDAAAGGEVDAWGDGGGLPPSASAAPGRGA